MTVRIDDFKQMAQRLVEGGSDPNDLLRAFEEAMSGVEDWARWGDGRWRRDYICSKCGSPYVGICGEGEHFSFALLRSPLLHRNQPGVERILRSEYNRRRAAETQGREGDSDEV